MRVSVVMQQFMDGLIMLHSENQQMRFAGGSDRLKGVLLLTMGNGRRKASANAIESSSIFSYGNFCLQAYNVGAVY